MTGRHAAARRPVGFTRADDRVVGWSEWLDDSETRAQGFVTRLDAEGAPLGEAVPTGPLFVANNDSPRLIPLGGGIGSVWNFAGRAYVRALGADGAPPMAMLDAWVPLGGLREALVLEDRLVLVAAGETTRLQPVDVGCSDRPATP